MSERQGSSVVTGLLIGTAIGAGLALLLAPASGMETRHRLGATTKQLKDGAQDKLNRVKQTFSKDGTKPNEIGSGPFADGRDDFRRTSAQPVGGRTTT
jgi:gas vesicle protein